MASALPAVPAQPSTWPTVLGVITVVLASLGLLSYTVVGGGAQIVNTVWPNFLVNSSDPTAQAQIQIQQKYQVWTITNAVVMTGFSVLLLVAGIRLLKRRRTARALFNAWAIARIAFLVPATTLGAKVAGETIEVVEQSMASNPQFAAMPPGLFGFIQGFSVIAFGCTTLVVLALPVFALIWMNRAKIKSEVAAWS